MKKLAALVACMLLWSSLSATEPFKVGDKVPEFKLPYATQDTVDMSGFGSADLKGKTYIIAFYPADWSPGCTKEMCTFRDSFSDLMKLNVTVLPISADLVYSHHAWAKAEKFQFKLLADQTRAFGTKMGVYLPEMGMFKRSVFVVGPDGTLKYIDYDYSVKDNSDYDALKSALAKM